MTPRMIRAIEVTAPGRIELVQRAAQARPRAADGALGTSLRLRVDAVGICGSDVALVTGLHPYAVYPITPGHEIAATVLEAPALSRLEPGQQVAVCPLLTCGHCTACRAGRPNHCPEVRVLGVHVNGGMADEITLPADMLRAVPDTLGPEATALVEPTAVAVHACRRAGGPWASGLEAGVGEGQAAAGDGASVAIIGTGIIGMLALQVARAWGAGPVLAVDRIPSRLHVAEGLGADSVVDTRESSAVEVGRELCPDGFDVVFDLVGHPTTLADAVALARPGGTIVLIALPHSQAEGDPPAGSGQAPRMASARCERLRLEGVHVPEPDDELGTGLFNFERLYRKELTLRATRLYDADFDAAIPLLASGPARTRAVDPRPLITHRFPMQDAERAFLLAAEHPDEAIKVLVKP